MNNTEICNTPVASKATGLSGSIRKVCPPYIYVSFGSLYSDPVGIPVAYSKVRNLLVASETLYKELEARHRRMLRRAEKNHEMGKLDAKAKFREQVKLAQARKKTFVERESSFDTFNFPHYEDRYLTAESFGI